MSRKCYVGMIVLLLLLLCGCEHKALCYLHPHGAKVRIDVDWSKFKEDQADGMTLFLFPGNEAQQHIQQTSHTITHAVFTLQPDDYLVMVHNQSTSEFGSVEFQGMSHYTTAEIRTVPTTSTWYKPSGSEKLGRCPEWLAFDRQDAEVTPEMVEKQMQDEHLSRAEADGDTLIATMVPENVVYTLHVSVKVKGVNNFRAGRAVITGMADGYFPGLERYHTDEVTHLLETWTVKDKTTGSDGVQTGTVTAEITCFGLPDNHQNKATENLLRISLLLVDNKTMVSRSFNVGNRFRQKTTNGSPLHLYLDLELSDKLPDVTPALGDNENGFDADVNDWGEDINQNVGM